MSFKQLFGLICLLTASVIYFVPSGGGSGPTPTPDDEVVIRDDVHEAFTTYERLWRKHRLQLADKLDRGELTETQAYTAIAESGEPMRAVSFDKINRQEADALSGKWSAEAHSKILRGYSDAVQDK